MPNLGPSHRIIGSDDPIIKRSGRIIGTDLEGAQGTPPKNEYRIYLLLIVPGNYSIPVTFPGRSMNEEMQ